MIWFAAMFVVGLVVTALTGSPGAGVFATFATYLLPFAIEGGRIK